MAACASRSSIAAAFDAMTDVQLAARGLEIAGAAEDLGARPVRGGEVGVDLQRAARFLLGRRRAPEPRQHQRVRGVRVRPIGRRRAELLELPARVVQLSQPQQQLGGQQAGVGVAGIDRQRGARLDERVRLRVAMHQHGRQVEVRLREIFVDGERGAKPLLGAGPVAAAQGDQPQPVLRFCDPRLVLERQREMSRGAIQLAAPQRLDARRLQGERARLERPRRGRAPDRQRREQSGRSGGGRRMRPFIGRPRVRLRRIGAGSRARTARSAARPARSPRRSRRPGRSAARACRAPRSAPRLRAPGNGTGCATRARSPPASARPRRPARGSTTCGCRGAAP